MQPRFLEGDKFERRGSGQQGWLERKGLRSPHG
jgi:hypothetical protein